MESKEGKKTKSSPCFFFEFSLVDVDLDLKMVSRLHFSFLQFVEDCNSSFLLPLSLSIRFSRGLSVPQLSP